MNLSFILLFFLGVAVRFYHYDHLSLWYDELYSMTVATSNVDEFFRELRIDVHPQIYQTLLFIWVKVVGNSPSAGRILSVIFSALAIPIVYFLSIKITDKFIALSTTIFLTLSGGAIYYAQEVRSYSLLILFSGVCFFYWLKLIKDVENPINKNSFYLFFIFSLITTYTHYFGFFFVNLQWVYLIIIFFKKDVHRFKFSIFGLILINLLFLPEIFRNIFIVASTGGGTWIPKPNLEIYMHFFSYVFYPMSFKKIPTLAIFFLSLVIPYLIDRKSFNKKIREEKVYYHLLIPTLYIISSLLLFTFLISQFKPLVTSRNLLVILIPIYFLVSTWYSLSPKLNGLKQSLVALVISGLMFASFSKYYYKDFIKEPWKDVTSYAAEVVGENGYVFSFRNSRMVDYYLVNVYKNRPSKNLNGSLKEFDKFFLEAKQFKVKNLVFIETPWDYINQEEDKKNIAIILNQLKENSLSSNYKFFYGMKVYSYELKFD